MLRRQLIVLDWFFGQFHSHLEPRDIIRYEDVVETGGVALFRRLGHAGALPAELTNRNPQRPVQFIHDRYSAEAVAEQRRPLDSVLQPRGLRTGGRQHPKQTMNAGRRTGPAREINVDAEYRDPMRRHYGPFGDFIRTVFSRFGAQTVRDHGVDGCVNREQARQVWFHRTFMGLSGGHLKHSHYFDHVLRMPGFTPRISFSGDTWNESVARGRQRLWPAGVGVIAEQWEPGSRDVLFLAGVDWRYLFESGLEDLTNPRLNLIQGVRHAHRDTELYRYLGERAIRICVSEEVADAISATGRTNGSVLTIPNGIDVAPFESVGDGSPARFEDRRCPIVIIGYKSPELAQGLSERLDAQRIEHRLVSEFLARNAFLTLLGESRIAVCLPHSEEGFLPACARSDGLGLPRRDPGLHRQPWLLPS